MQDYTEEVLEFIESVADSYDLDDDLDECVDV